MRRSTKAVSMLMLAVGMVSSGARASAQQVPVKPGVTASGVSVRQAGPDSLRIARLSAVGRLWGVVRYFHPALGDRDGGWDASTAAAIERVRTAGTTGEYVAAVSTLLGTLHDPATRVLPSGLATPPAGAMPVTTRWEVVGTDSTLVVAIPVFDDSATARLRNAAGEIRRAPRVVFDLRGPRPSDESDAEWTFDRSGIDSLLPATRVAAPTVRTREHSGFPTQVGRNSGGYSEGTRERPGKVFPPRSDALRRRIVFLANTWSDIPPIALALRSNGQGAVVVDGTSSLLELPTYELYSAPLGEGVTAVIRTWEYTGTLVDTVLKSGGSGDQPFQAALALAHRAVSLQPAPFIEPRAHDVDSLPGAAYPTVGYRVLAAYQWWNVIHYFYPYKDLIGEDWDAVLSPSVAQLEAARDSVEYALSLAEMITHIHDSHGTLFGAPGLGAALGVAFVVGVQLQYIGGQPVVIAAADDSTAQPGGLAVGDVILKVDGEDVSARRSRLARYLAYSTPQSLDAKIAPLLLRGAAGAARLTVRDHDDRIRELSVPRTTTIPQQARYARTGPILKVLPGNVGYADLARLTVAMVDSMFEMFKSTTAIIFDDRGYPQGTAWAIAPRLTDQSGIAAALFERPLVATPYSTTWTTYHFVQRLPTTQKWRYHGKTVLLVDERAISQAEHTGLFLEAANHTTIIGSPTAGANGDITQVAFAGGARGIFTGHNVRHANGRQLQRVGLQPDIVVRPTLKGIRAGRDEVLERALVFLSGGEH